MLAQMPVQWINSVGDYNGDGTVHVTMLVENSPGGDQTLEQTVQALDAYNYTGITYDYFRVDVPTQDYSPQVARIVAGEQTPDVLLVQVAGDAALDVLRQLLDAGIGPQKGTLLVVGRSALDGQQFWQRVPDGALTVVGRRGPWSSNLTPMGQGFVDRYRQFSTQWPEPAAFAGYDADPPDRRCGPTGRLICPQGPAGCARNDRCEAGSWLLPVPLSTASIRRMASRIPPTCGTNGRTRRCCTCSTASPCRTRPQSTSSGRRSIAPSRNRLSGRNDDRRLLAPIGRRKEDKDRVKLEAAEQHAQNQHPLDHCVQVAIVVVGTDAIHTGSDVAKHRHDRA